MAAFISQSVAVKKVLGTVASLLNWKKRELVVLVKESRKERTNVGKKTGKKTKGGGKKEKKDRTNERTSCSVTEFFIQ